MIQLIAVVLLAITLTSPAHTSSATDPHGLPRSVFPPHSKLHFRSEVTNAVIDCMWSFGICDEATGLPVTSVPEMHTRTMDRLHRTGGWEEDGAAPSGIGFALWVNRFPSPSLAEAACIDFGRAQIGSGFAKPAHRFAGVGSDGAWTKYLFGGATMNLLCVWRGFVEIESASYWLTGDAPAGASARRYQRAQIEVALID